MVSGGPHSWEAIWWSGPLSMCFRASTCNFTRTSATARQSDAITGSKPTANPELPWNSPNLLSLARHDPLEKRVRCSQVVEMISTYFQQTNSARSIGRSVASAHRQMTRLWPGGRMRSGRGNWWALTMRHHCGALWWSHPPPKKKLGWSSHP